LGVACDTCGRRAYLFQLPGRKDSNCAECCADIETLVLLYERLRIAECDGEDASDLQGELVSVLDSFMGRLEASGNVSVQSWGLPEALRQSDHVN
jgi:hypothetical protein